MVRLRGCSVAQAGAVIPDRRSGNVPALHPRDAVGITGTGCKGGGFTGGCKTGFAALGRGVGGQFLARTPLCKPLGWAGAVKRTGHPPQNTGRGGWPSPVQVQCLPPPPLCAEMGGGTPEREERGQKHTNAADLDLFMALHTKPKRWHLTGAVTDDLHIQMACSLPEPLCLVPAKDQDVGWRTGGAVDQMHFPMHASKKTLHDAYMSLPKRPTSRDVGVGPTCVSGKIAAPHGRRFGVRDLMSVLAAKSLQSGRPLCCGHNNDDGRRPQECLREHIVVMLPSIVSSRAHIRRHEIS